MIEFAKGIGHAFARAAYSRLVRLPNGDGATFQIDSPPDRILNKLLCFNTQVERLQYLRSRGIKVTEVDTIVLAAERNLRNYFISLNIDLGAPMTLPPQYLVDPSAQSRLPEQYRNSISVLRRIEGKAAEAIRRERYGYGNNDLLLAAVLKWVQTNPDVADALIDGIGKALCQLQLLQRFPVEMAVPFIYLTFERARSVEEIMEWVKFTGNQNPQLIPGMMEAYDSNRVASRGWGPELSHYELISFPAWLLSGMELSFEAAVPKEALDAGVFVTSTAC